MMKQLCLVSIFLALVFVLFACVIQDNRFPPDAKECGDYWVKCTPVKQGIYICRIYDVNKKFIKEQEFILPYRNWRKGDREVTYRVTGYDGENITLDKGVKLLPCGVPYEADLIRGVEGLVWVKYELINPKDNTFYCEIFSTNDGGVLSSGAYVLKSYYWDTKKKKTVYRDVKIPVKFLALSYYGGISITLKNKLVLMPAETIDYPAGPYNGLRVSYDKEGNEVSREEY